MQEIVATLIGIGATALLGLIGWLIIRMISNLDKTIEEVKQDQKMTEQNFQSEIGRLDDSVSQCQKDTAIVTLNIKNFADQLTEKLVTFDQLLNKKLNEIGSIEIIKEIRKDIKDITKSIQGVLIQVGQYEIRLENVVDKIDSLKKDFKDHNEITREH